MKSYPTAEQVLTDLGDKVVEALGQAVTAANDDLAEYRSLKPSWVAESSKRGMANWLHDRMFAHLERLMLDMEGVLFTGTGPTREILVGSKYRFRAKKHTETGAVASLQTPAALEFYLQPDDLLTELGFDIIHLCVGYEWNDELNVMVSPVLSLRDGFKGVVIWMEALPWATPATGFGTVVPVNPASDPDAPKVEIDIDIDTDQAEDSNPT